MKNLETKLTEKNLIIFLNSNEQKILATATHNLNNYYTGMLAVGKTSSAPP